ncbi:MAG: hypothetical protein C0582_04600 [Alphaproteobacteria bacterium]|nr:MAG: hypothetical protein C0582_04600 [Alphaproteobacteria bacterium]
MTDPSPQNKKDDAQEIEIKLKLSPTDHSTLKSWLLKNTKPGAVQHQTDLYFENPHRPFFKPDSHGHIQALKYFRLRSIPNGPCFLTFKDWDTPASSAGDRLFCYEHETEVSNKEHMLKIITALGYTKQYSLQKSGLISIIQTLSSPWIRSPNLERF